MHSHFVKNHPIRILEDGPLISEVVLSQPRCRVAATAGRGCGGGVREGDAGAGGAADGLLASAELVTHSRWRKANLYFLSREHRRVIWSFKKTDKICSFNEAAPNSESR
jgi:hypothetical protein